MVNQNFVAHLEQIQKQLSELIILYKGENTKEVLRNIDELENNLKFVLGVKFIDKIEAKKILKELHKIKAKAISNYILPKKKIKEGVI